MATVNLKTAGAADFERVFAYIQRQGDAENLPEGLRLDADTLRRDWLGEYQGEAVFAEVEGHSAGFAICLPGAVVPDIPDALYFAGIFVDPEFRMQGVGLTFVAWLVERARAYGRHQVVWCCLVENAAAIAFSRKLGASELGERTVQIDSGASRQVRLYGLLVP